MEKSKEIFLGGIDRNLNFKFMLLLIKQACGDGTKFHAASMCYFIPLFLWEEGENFCTSLLLLVTSVQCVICIVYFSLDNI